MEAIIGIIIVIGIIYAYFCLMGWLFTAVAPGLLTLLVLFGVIPVFIAYLQTLFETYNNPRRKIGILSWMIIAVMIAFIYVEFASQLCIILGPIMRDMKSYPTLLLEATPFFNNLQRTIHGWIMTLVFKPTGFQGVPILLERTSALFSTGLFIFVETIPIVLMLFVARGLQNTVADTSQPAFRQYFSGQVWLDLKGVFENAPKRLFGIYQHVKYIIPGLNHKFEAIGFFAFFLWPLILTVLVSLIAPALVSGVAIGILLICHSMTVLTIILIAAGLSTVLYVIERSIMFIRSGYAKCPHAGCYESVPLPVYQCPDCGVKHTRLIPGRTGVLLRTCKCSRKLPTLFWLGKAKLLGYCPHCDGPMSHQLIGGNVHVPIYGGPSSGKTMFMMASTWQLVEGKIDGLKASFVENNDKKRYEDRWKADYEGGRLREKTVDLLPNAFLLSLRRKLGLAASLYMYDPAGEAMERQELESHRFLKHYNGLALLVDPLSLSQIAERYREEVGAEPPNTTSPKHPMDAVNYIVNVLEGHAQLTRTRKQSKNLAVVVTKGDLPVVQKELGVTLPDKLPDGTWKKLGEANSVKMREWFARNEPALLQTLETRFHNVRFFLVSALGHRPEELKAFRPKDVLAPLFWLLSTERLLAIPNAMRAAIHVTEVAVVASVIVLFLGLFSLAVKGSIALRNHLPQSGDAYAEVQQATNSQPVENSKRTKRRAGSSKKYGDSGTKPSTVEATVQDNGSVTRSSAQDNGPELVVASLLSSPSIKNKEKEYRYGIMLLEGKKITKDTDKAVSLLKQSAEHGSVKAQKLLGGLYYKGDTVAQDYGEAAKFYRMAAEGGAAEAQHFYGMMLAKGVGVNKDIPEATTWIRKSADQGFEDAKKVLAQIESNR